jgi:hypothetical protein
MLGCVLVLQNVILPPSAQAGTATRAGIYAVTTAMEDEDSELLWLVDVDAQNLSVYGVDNNGFISELARANLGMVFSQQVQTPTPTPAPTRTRVIEPGSGTTPGQTPGGGTSTQENPPRRPR